MTIKREIYEELRKIYNSLLEEIIKLIGYCNFDDPTQIFTLFNFMIENRCFGQFTSSLVEKEDIRGISVVGNNGICRHRSSMLKDLFNKLSIEAMVLYGYVDSFFRLDNYHTINYDDMKRYIHLSEKVKDGFISNELLEEIKALQIGYTIPDLRDIDYLTSIKKFPNHAIVLAGDTQKYFFDSTLNCTYYPVLNEKITTKNNRGIYFFLIPPSKMPFFAVYPGQAHVAYSKISMLEVAAEDVVNMQIRDTLKYLRKTNGIIDEFKRLHEPLVHEIETKLKLIQ